MALEASDALTQLVIFAGILVGNVGGGTVIPYIKAKTKYEEFDIKILFDNKFLLTCAGSAVITFIAISGTFSSFIDQVLAGHPVTYLAAFLAALGLGCTLNLGINSLLPSPTNKEAQKELQDKMAFKTLENKGIDVNRLHELIKKD